MKLETEPLWYKQVMRNSPNSFLNKYPKTLNFTAQRRYMTIFWLSREPSSNPLFYLSFKLDHQCIVWIWTNLTSKQFGKYDFRDVGKFSGGHLAPGCYGVCLRLIGSGGDVIWNVEKL